MFALTDRLESPHVVTQLCPADESGVGHVIQVAKGCRFVDASVGQMFCNIGVSERRSCLMQQLERCNTGLRSTQSCFAYRLLKFFDVWFRDFASPVFEERASDIQQSARIFEILVFWP